MSIRLAVVVLLSVTCAARAFAADEQPQQPTPEPKSHMKDVLKTRTAEEAKKKPAATPLVPTLPAKAEDPAAVAASPAAPAAAAPAATEPAKAPTVAEQPATVLPKVEVKKDRVTVLDHNLAVQEKEIAREKKNNTPTELDKALNDPKVSKALSIFGGQSSDNRASVSKERVKMMEEEKEVIEAIAHAKTKAEKEALQKELDQLKALRRELEKSLR